MLLLLHCWLLRGAAGWRVLTYAASSTPKIASQGSVARRRYKERGEFRAPVIERQDFGSR
jgi:hypothetical protein